MVDQTPTRTEAGRVDRDEASDDGRRETPNEKLDRNWNEILQELRVTQTGTQILTGFLLTLVFQPKFDQLDDFQRTVYLVLVALASLTTVLGLAPVLIHRELFRRRLKGTVVAGADIFLRCALGGIGAVLMGTQLLVFDVAVGRTAGLVAATVTGCVLLGIALLPLVIRSRRGRDDPTAGTSRR